MRFLIIDKNKLGYSYLPDTLTPTELREALLTEEESLAMFKEIWDKSVDDCNDSLLTYFDGCPYVDKEYLVKKFEEFKKSL